MSTSFIISCLVSLLALPCCCYGQTQKETVNFLAIQGPITVQKDAYHLVWSSHPDASLYKQEYLTAGDRFPNYKSMVTVDFVVTESSIDQAIATKVRQLDELKKTNPIVNYEVIGNKATGEKIIDCLIGQTAADERNSVVERDVFRYKVVKLASGHRGVLLFAVSQRKYGNDIKPFLLKLKTDKPILIGEVAKRPMPEINLAK